MNGTIGFLDLKNMELDANIIILGALVQKLRSKTCIIVANVTHLHASHAQTAQDIFYFLKGFDPSYLVLKCGNILPVNN